MKLLDRLNERFPEFALAIRRLQRDDPAFRELCDDYDEATRASVYWRAYLNLAEERASQYKVLVTDLEQEIDAMLRGPLR